MKIEEQKKIESEMTDGPWHAVNDEDGGINWPMVKATLDELNPYGIHICELRSEDGENAIGIAMLRNHAKAYLELVEASNSVALFCNKSGYTGEIFDRLNEALEKIENIGSGE